MKRVFKYFWYGVSGLVIVAVAMMIADDKDNNTKDIETTVTVTENATDAAEEGADDAKEGSEGKDTGKITKAEFEAIESGMTYDEVVEIIGGPGEVMSESGNEGEAAHTVMYSWDGVGQLGANANATFQGGELINKAQFGLGE